MPLETCDSASLPPARGRTKKLSQNIARPGNRYSRESLSSIRIGGGNPENQAVRRPSVIELSRSELSFVCLIVGRFEPVKAEKCDVVGSIAEH